MKHGLVILLLLLLLPGGCQDLPGADNSDDVECLEIKETYTLSGHVAFDAYTEGPIELTFTEDATSACGVEKGIISTRTPGELLGRVTLDEPGPFEITLTSTRLRTSGEVWNGHSGVYVIATNEPTADQTECAGAALLLLPQQDQVNVRIDLKPQSCPILL